MAGQGPCGSGQHGVTWHSFPSMQMRYRPAQKGSPSGVMQHSAPASMQELAAAAVDASVGKVVGAEDEDEGEGADGVTTVGGTSSFLFASKTAASALPNGNASKSCTAALS